MIQGTDLDFRKKSRLKNVKFMVVDGSLASLYANELNESSLLAYHATLNRLVICDGSKVEVLALQSDVPKVAPTIYYVNTNPQLISGNVVKRGDIWINDARTIRVYNNITNAWDNVQTESIITIPDHSSIVSYQPNTMVVYNNSIYQNRTGLVMLAGSFETQTWTALTSRVNRIVAEIPTIFPNFTTIGYVYRSGDTYTITHNFASDSILVQARVMLTNETYLVDYTKVNPNSLTINFDVSLTEALIIEVYNLIS